jgi:hypothetical protein
MPYPPPIDLDDRCDSAGTPTTFVLNQGLSEIQENEFADAFPDMAQYLHISESVMVSDCCSILKAMMLFQTYDGHVFRAEFDNDIYSFIVSTCSPSMNFNSTMFRRMSTKVIYENLSNLATIKMASYHQQNKSKHVPTELLLKIKNSVRIMVFESSIFEDVCEMLTTPCGANVEIHLTSQAPPASNKISPAISRSDSTPLEHQEAEPVTIVHEMINKSTASTIENSGDSDICEIKDQNVNNNVASRSNSPPIAPIKMSYVRERIAENIDISVGDFVIYVNADNATTNDIAFMSPDDKIQNWMNSMDSPAEYNTAKDRDENIAVCMVTNVCNKCQLYDFQKNSGKKIISTNFSHAERKDSDVELTLAYRATTWSSLRSFVEKTSLDIYSCPAPIDV